MIPKSGSNLKRNLFFVSKMTIIWWILIWALKSLKEMHFDWSLLCKVYTNWPKKVQWSIFHDTKELCKIWRKTDLWFGKCQNWYFHRILLLKVENAWATNYMSYIGVISNDTEEWWKIWRKIELLFQNWHKEFDEFWPRNSKVSKIYSFMGCFWPNYIMFELKKYRWVMFNCTQDWYKTRRKTGLCFQKFT